MRYQRPVSQQRQEKDGHDEPDENSRDCDAIPAENEPVHGSFPDAVDGPDRTPVDTRSLMGSPDESMVGCWVETRVPSRFET